MIQLTARQAAAWQEAAAATASDFAGQETFRERYPHLRRQIFQKIASRLATQMKAQRLDLRNRTWRLTDTEAERIIEVDLPDDQLQASDLLLRFLICLGVITESERQWQGARQMIISQRTCS